MEMQRRFIGLWLPAEIIYNKELTLQEKILVVDVDSFEECWESNRTIADKLNISVDRASRLLHSMEKKGILNIVIQRNEKGQVIKRVISVRNDFKRKMFELSLKNTDTPPGENTDTLPVKTPNREYKYESNNYIEKERADKSAAPQTRKPKRFVPPTLEEVQAYCTERGNLVDAQSFVDFYESKGWYVGKNKMKDWKAAVRTWERRNAQQPRRMSRAERQRAEDAELERMCKEYDSRHGETDSNDTPWKLPG